MCQNKSSGQRKYAHFILVWIKHFMRTFRCVSGGYYNSFIMIYDVRNRHTLCFLMHCVYETLKTGCTVDCWRSRPAIKYIITGLQSAAVGKGLQKHHIQRSKEDTWLNFPQKNSLRVPKSPWLRTKLNKSRVNSKQSKQTGGCATAPKPHFQINSAATSLAGAAGCGETIMWQLY